GARPLRVADVHGLVHALGGVRAEDGVGHELACDCVQHQVPTAITLTFVATAETATDGVLLSAIPSTLTVPPEIDVPVAIVLGSVVALLMALTTAPAPVVPAPKLPPVSIALSPVAMPPVPVIAPWATASLRAPLDTARSRLAMTPMDYCTGIGTATGGEAP